MEKISYKLETFEGPLDLLLHLIAKNRMDIREIRISELVDQYMKHLGVMREQDMDVTSEFLEMASRLLYIKTVSLLPKHEEAEQLQRELSGQLLEYRECRRIAALLAERFSFDSFVREPAQIEPDLSYRRHHTPQELFAAYRSAVGRGRRLLPPSPEEFSGIVRHRIVSVASRIFSVLRRLRPTGSAGYEDLFRGVGERSGLVATFLAVLELVKGKRIRLEGNRGDRVILLKGGDRKWTSEESEER